MNKKWVSRIVFSVISIVLAAVLSLTVGTVSMSDAARELKSDEKIEYITAGNPTFRIVRPEDSGVQEGLVSVEVFKKYKEIYGVSPKQVTDSEIEDGVREILIGDTNREATQKAKQLLLDEGSTKSCDYIICSVGDDIVIYGNSGKSLQTAGEIFFCNFLGEPQNDGVYYMYKGENHEGSISICDISELSRFTVVRPIYNVSYLTQVETDRLCEILYNKTGYLVDIIHDNEAKSNPDITARGGILEKTPVTDYEIIIGDCARDNVKKPDKYYNYEIRIENTKIYLNGGSPYATAMAVSEFCKLVENNDKIDRSMSVLNGNYNDAVKNYDTASYYRPVWWDEFDLKYIDTGKWNVLWDRKENSAVDGKPCYRGSSELKNNYTEDGCLVIAAAKTDEAYYGGMLQTDKSMEFLYGYLEISNIHPLGAGFWTALWTVSKSSRYNKDMWYSETDIDECFGNGTSVQHNSWAWPTSYGRKKLGLHSGRADTVMNGGDFASTDSRALWMDFHTYGFLWEDNTHVKFTVDGYVTHDAVFTESELQTAYSQYMFLKLSMATAFKDMGGITNDEWQWENTNKLIVDWVYLYQIDGQKIMTF